MVTLIIVESPNKIKKIQEILGSQYRVVASAGHIWELDKVDVKNNYNMIYKLINNKRSIVSKMEKAANECDQVIIATDNDREGEMIGHCIAEQLQITNPQRITFNSITRDAIVESLENIRTIDMKLVESQNARRAVDRMIGFELSPLLWRTIGRNAKSAGRVQSVVLRLIVNREHEIENHQYTSKPKITGNASTLYQGKTNNLPIELHGPIDNPSDTMKELITGQYTIESITTSETHQHPPPPYITSTLQQDAHHILKWSVSKTMSVAQKLYESGHITYMRTDSPKLSIEAINQIKKYVSDKYGSSYIQTRSITMAKEAHEAIRPTRISRLNVDDGNALYKLIWTRAIASQMTPAVFNTHTFKIINDQHDYHFTSKKNQLIKLGYLILTRELDPPITFPPIGSPVLLTHLKCNDEYTNPKSRYNEATIIKKMDDCGIGRPSTYANTVDKIIERQYVEIADTDGITKPINTITWNRESNVIESHVSTIQIGSEKKRLIPTETGKMVCKFLITRFPDIMTTEFTAQVETQLDEIASSDRNWIEVVDQFYKPFHQQVLATRKSKSQVIAELGVCPITGHPITVQQDASNSIRVVRKSQYVVVDNPNITLESAIKLFKYPVILGEYQSKPVILNHSVYGHYISWNNTNIKCDQYVNLESAIQLIISKSNNTVWIDGDYSVIKAKYGYCISVRNGKQRNFYKIPKTINPLEYEWSTSVIKSMISK